MDNQQTKFEKFRDLHTQDCAFVMPNAWDAGSALILSTFGFQALATTSAGYAFSVGRRDSFAGLSQAEILNNAHAIADATDLPVSADLEDGFGPRPQNCADTVLKAVACGLVGGSIEDATGDSAAPVYELTQAVERVAAAVDAAKDRPFLLTARAENFICDRPDLADTIARLQAFSEAGADVLYAPGLPDLEAIRTVCQEVDKPVNVVMGLKGKAWSVDQLSQAGVRRISVGGSFARAAIGAMMRAAQEVHETGTFSYADQAVPDAAVAGMMRSDKVDDRS